MANKAISELPQAQNVNNQDLFVLEQSGIAKKLTAETFITEQGIIDALAEALDGHGGIQSVTLSSVSGRIRTYRITFSDGSATTFQVYDGTSIERISRTSSSGLDDVYTVFLSDGTTTFFTVHNGADGDVSEATLNSELAKKAPVITETVSSTAIAAFADGADDMPMQSVLVDIEPVQDLSNGDPSPTNICPITGHTEVNVTRTGKNLWGFTADDFSDPVLYGQAKFIDVQLPAGIYTISTNAPTGYIWAGLNLPQNSSRVYENNPQTITLSSGDVLCLGVSRDYTAAALAYNNQLEFGGEATTFEQFGTTYPITFPSSVGTVYGGTIDVATGLLTVTMANIASYNGESLPSTWISDRDVYAEGTTPTTGAQVVYTLSTSQTYQLTGQDLNTLLGNNAVWADTGNVTVTYPADTKMFIENLTQPTEDDLVANQAITSGQYFMIGNLLYLALANIASGAQITIGTNAQRVSLADALNTINS